MSGKNNVNKDHYVMAGRDKPDDNAAARMQARGVPSDGGGPHRGDAQPNFIPGAAPVGESPEPRDMPAPPDARTSAGKTGVRGGSRKGASANRGGGTRAHARPEAGASGTVNRRPANRKTAKRGTTRADASARRPAARAAGRSKARTTKRAKSRRRAA